MIVFEDGKYAIDSDRYQWRVLTPGGVDKRTGQGTWKPILFYTTFEGAVKGMTDLCIRLSDYSSLEELAENINSLSVRILKVLNGTKVEFTVSAQRK